MSAVTFLAAVLNAAVLSGSLVVKLPQLLCIGRARSVLGLSEASFALQAVGYSLTCCYALLLGYPFAAWGESGIITVQAFMILLMFWVFDKGINVRLRFACTAAWTAALFWLVTSGSVLPQLLALIGYTPGVIFFVARMPQILLNHRQGHTGELSAATHALQLAGCLARIFTTFAQLGGDSAMLLGQGSAALLNAVLLWQMYRYRKVTRVVTSSSAASPHK
eukprot:TRINITY_DN25259_c0_g1_i2.p1 TRINITY_DN25259_c0_g1~~TRINITY_DN25259_c0_g1_i2.p1  ORF type:complete len:233 (-),score=46.55 TRINITY_DN25259_c0_g1_i2:23-685(-)